MSWDDVIVESVLGVRVLILTIVESLEVGLVLSEEKSRDDLLIVDWLRSFSTSARRGGRSWRGRTVEVRTSKVLVIGLDNVVIHLLHLWFGWLLLWPEPIVLEEHLRNDVKVGWVRSTIVCADTNRHGVNLVFIFGVLLKERVRKIMKER